MNALPWPDASFDVATSFRGIWATTPAAVGELHRVLTPGGRVGITVWGHIRASPGGWALAPFRLAEQHKRDQPAFLDAAAGQARDHLRDGLPLRIEIAVVGYLARKPVSRMAASRGNPARDPGGR